MIEDNIISTEANEKTVLVGLITQRQSEQKTLEYLQLHLEILITTELLVSTLIS